MFLSTFAALLAALSVGAPATSASAATTPVAASASASPSCPAGYNGPTNLATGCPWWLMR